LQGIKQGKKKDKDINGYIFPSVDKERLSN